MAQYRFTFNNNSLNASLQIGDNIYYATSTLGVLSTPLLAGYVININTIPTGFEIIAETGSIVVTAGDFILFSKPIKINESGLKGYYADVTLENNSKERVELFAVSSEIVPSSK